MIYVNIIYGFSGKAQANLILAHHVNYFLFAMYTATSKSIHTTGPG